MLASVVFLACMNTVVYSVRLWEPDASSLVSSFIRTAVNFVIVIAFALSQSNLRQLVGDGRPSLWLRGLFGATALILGFASIQTIPLGQATFLHSTNAAFVALLSPIFLGQKNRSATWLALICAFIGAGLVLRPSADQGTIIGQLLAVGTGLSMALAFLMVAKSGASNSPLTIIFYFCVVGLLIHSMLFLALPQQWPREPRSYAMLIVAGFFATGSQYFMTSAYQKARASLVATVGYVGPVLNLLSGVFFFGEKVTATQLCGAVIIIVSSVAMPFLIAKKSQPQGAAKTEAR